MIKNILYMHCMYNIQLVTQYDIGFQVINLKNEEMLTCVDLQWTGQQNNIHYYLEQLSNIFNTAHCTKQLHI